MGRSDLYCRALRGARMQSVSRSLHCMAATGCGTGFRPVGLAAPILIMSPIRPCVSLRDAP
jgi:hypothetical protein